MSNVNIIRAVENIKSGTTIYTPIVEVIVNAIQAIESKPDKKGDISIIVERSDQYEMDDSLPSVENFEVRDDGIGFTDKNLSSFDTLYSDQKISEGGKGFGRFICLKYFKDFVVDSVFRDGNDFKRRTFYMGKKHDIVEGAKTMPSESTQTGSVVRLVSVKTGKFPDKKIPTIARNIVEKILPFFISSDHACPKIVVSEKDKTNPIVLNDFVSNQLSGVIKEISVAPNSYSLKGKGAEFKFSVRVFKFYSPKSQKSKISLVAHRREVTDTAIHNYVPEFYDEFYDRNADGIEDRERNYIIKAYVFSEYLDSNVSLERAGFEFQKENDLLLGISQNEIERAASEIAKQAIGSDITTRQEKKKERVHSYVEEQAPWHREILKKIDLSGMPCNPSPEDIETRLQREKYNQEVSIKREVGKLLAETNPDDLKANVAEIVNQISGTSKNDLVHYIALRKNVLDIFKKSLELDPDGKYSSEGVVHDIIFPRRSSTETTAFNDHNLWIIDERLNFTSYVSSDLHINSADRPDLLVYDKRVLFRGDNEPSNPIMIFEFKKPQRDNFVNPSSSKDEDPIEQIVRYVNSIRDGDIKTPEGRQVLIADNTPFYGYVVCDLTKKVKKWLEDVKDLKPMPDQLGYFGRRDNINLYIEVLSWDKVLKDANMRNRIFFHKLGI